MESNMTDSMDIDHAYLSSSPQQHDALLDSLTASTTTSVQHDLLLSSEKATALWNLISESAEFVDKYGRNSGKPSVLDCYLFSRQARIDTFVFEAFAAVRTASIMKEELVYHPMFEGVIERFTHSRAKPNPLLMETRSTDFCYRLAILIEAVSQRTQRPELRLVREFGILSYVWERFSRELASNQAQPDFLVGIPMPFEFVNIAGSPEYDFIERFVHGVRHRGLLGEDTPLTKLAVPGTVTPVRSTLSYMSVEKLGPTVHYMMDLMKSQRRLMTISSALKIFDQLLCRLMVLHRYGVVLGNIDPKFVNFGVREAAKVVYISRFDCATIVPTQHRHGHPYSERFASLAALRRREVHFADDIESAFYLFLSLIFPSLPWDAIRPANHDALSSASVTSTPGSGRSTGTSADEKISFWSSSSMLERMLPHLNFEFTDETYQGFTMDLIVMLYAKSHEFMAQCEAMTHSDFMALLLTPSSPANNAYSGIRRVLATYFQFERLSNITKDPVCHKKVEILLRVEPEGGDRRVLWNLNDWCWNALCPSFGSRTKSRTLSMMI